MIFFKHYFIAITIIVVAYWTVPVTLGEPIIIKPLRGMD